MTVYYLHVLCCYIKVYYVWTVKWFSVQYVVTYLSKAAQGIMLSSDGLKNPDPTYMLVAGGAFLDIWIVHLPGGSVGFESFWLELLPYLFITFKSLKVDTCSCAVENLSFKLVRSRFDIK